MSLSLPKCLYAPCVLPQPPERYRYAAPDDELSVVIPTDYSQFELYRKCYDHLIGYSRSSGLAICGFVIFADGTYEYEPASALGRSSECICDKEASDLFSGMLALVCLLANSRTALTPQLVQAVESNAPYKVRDKLRDWYMVDALGVLTGRSRGCDPAEIPGALFKNNSMRCLMHIRPNCVDGEGTLWGNLKTVLTVPDHVVTVYSAQWAWEANRRIFAKAFPWAASTEVDATRRRIDFVFRTAQEVNAATTTLRWKRKVFEIMPDRLV